MRIDGYDRRILEVLQQDGRISNQDLAERIGSPGFCIEGVGDIEGDLAQFVTTRAAMPSAIASSTAPGNPS